MQKIITLFLLKIFSAVKSIFIYLFKLHRMIQQPLLKAMKRMPTISKKLTIKKAISVHHVGHK